MGQMGAKENDQVTGLCTHVVMVPNPGGAVPTPLPHPFAGKLDTKLSGDVKIMGKKAATKGSVATNAPSHFPTSPGTAFQNPPDNKAKVTSGSQTVKINGKPAARVGDPAELCGGTGVVVGASTVFIG